MHKNCLICERIELILQGKNPYFVCELLTGYVVMGDHQFFRGYTLFLCKQHKTELHQLNVKYRKQFLYEMSIVAEAVYHVFHPKKLNYEMLGNTDHHMHWHIFPRHKNDPMPNKVVWLIDKPIRENKKTIPDVKTLKAVTAKLKKEIQKRKNRLVRAV